MVGSEIGCQQALLIGGPTGIGKTNLSMALQDLLGGVSRTSLISVDSAMVYRGMDIGTAKPSVSQQRRVKHFLIDIQEPIHPINVKQFQDIAQHSIKKEIKKTYFGKYRRNTRANNYR